jgi:hypothetical protein
VPLELKDWTILKLTRLELTMKFSILRFSVSGGGAEDEDGACNNRWTHSVDPQLQVNLEGAELRVENGARLLVCTTSVSLNVCHND